MFLPEIKKNNIYESADKEFPFKFDRQEFMLNTVSVLPITMSCKISGMDVPWCKRFHQLDEWKMSCENCDRKRILFSLEM